MISTSSLKLATVKCVQTYTAIVSILLCSSFLPNNDLANLRGYIKGLQSGQIIITVKDLATTIRIDTINVISEKFSYEVECTYPHIIELQYDDQTVQSFIDPGSSLIFSGTAKFFAQGTFKGSKTEDERNDREQQRVHGFATAKPKTAIDSSFLSFSIDSLWAMKHRQSYLTLMTLVNNVYDFNFTDVLQIYEGAPEIYKRSIIGHKLLALIEESKLKPVGSVLPDLQWRDLNGQQKHLRELKDQGIRYALLDFWGSYCIPCIENIPLLKEIENKYKPLGLQIISISVDKDETVWKKSIVKEKIDKWIAGIEIDKDPIAGKMGIETIPSYFIIDLASWTVIGRFNTRSLRQGRAERLLNGLIQSY